MRKPYGIGIVSVFDMRSEIEGLSVDPFRVRILPSSIEWPKKIPKGRGLLDRQSPPKHLFSKYSRTPVIKSLLRLGRWLGTNFEL
jgi:hypothetical protein